MAMKKKVPDRSPFMVLGRDIGTGTGWDVIEFSQIVIYDFEPGPNVNIPKGDLSVEFDNGCFHQYDDFGVPSWSADMVTMLKDLPLSIKRGREGEDMS